MDMNGEEEAAAAAAKKFKDGKMQSEIGEHVGAGCIALTKQAAAAAKIRREKSLKQQKCATRVKDEFQQGNRFYNWLLERHSLFFALAVVFSFAVLDILYLAQLCEAMPLFLPACMPACLTVLLQWC